jgi:hypothetical protein
MANAAIRIEAQDFRRGVRRSVVYYKDAEAAVGLGKNAVDGCREEKRAIEGRYYDRNFVCGVWIDWRRHRLRFRSRLDVHAIGAGKIAII